MKASNFEKWDMHHHIIPKFYVDELESVGVTKIFDFEQPKWTEEMQLKMMEKHNITKAFMSISTPGVYFNGKEFSRRLARKCNSYMAELIKKNPDKLGGFAAVPLPDVDSAIAELKYSLDILKFDGIGLLSNVEGNYLGNKKYRRFFKELNDRNATVFIHPTAPPNKKEHKLLNYMYLFVLDTTRTIIDFVRSGYHRDFPNIKFILSHGGGVLPALYPALINEFKSENPNIETEFEIWKKQLFPDTARIAYHDTMETTIEFSGINHLVLGTDYIWAKNNFAYWIKLISTLDLKEEYIQDIFKNNAEKALKTKEKIGEITLENKIAYRNSKKESIKYHYHYMPSKVCEHLKNIGLFSSMNEYEPQDINEVLSYMDINHYDKIMLSLEIPELWEQDEKNIATTLRLYNNELAKITSLNSAKIGALGAIDVDNVEEALHEIDRCINELQLNGLCIYIKIYDSSLEEIIDTRILEKLNSFNVPILVHPKNSQGIPVANEYYLDSVYLVAKMLYLNKFEYLNNSQYILTHTGGIVPFMAQNIGLLYYMQLNKKNMGKFMIDWLIKKHLVGYEFLKSIQIDD